MENSLITYSGWLLTFISVIINLFQLKTNNELRNKLDANQKAGNESTLANQNNSGEGDNINIGRDANINK